jgi:hypothetical protein
VARELSEAGWPKARAIVGGWTEWQKVGLPVQAKPTLLTQLR